MVRLIISAGKRSDRTLGIAIASEIKNTAYVTTLFGFFFGYLSSHELFILITTSFKSKLFRFGLIFL